MWFVITRSSGARLAFVEAESAEQALAVKNAATSAEGMSLVRAHGWLPLGARPARDDELYQARYGCRSTMIEHLRSSRAWRRERGHPATAECVRRWKPGDVVEPDGYVEKAYCIREAPGPLARVLATTGEFVMPSVVGTPIY